MLSFEEFCNKAFEIYKACLMPGFSEAEITPYFYGEEAQKHLKSEYQYALNKSEETKEDHTESIAISCGSCLSLMF